MRSSRPDRSWALPLRLVTLGLFAFALSACDGYPRDPDHTLTRVLRTERFIAVAVDHSPWVATAEGRDPSGVEVDLVETFAQDLGVDVEWRRAPAFEALEAMERGDADLVVGGFTKEALKAHTGSSSTYAYVTERLVVAAEPGTPVPRALDGLKVVTPPELMADRLVTDENGIPTVEDGPEVFLHAVLDWTLPERDLVPTGIVLRREDHVFAVPKGENAWITRVERFLRQRADDVGAMLRAHDQ